MLAAPAELSLAAFIPIEAPTKRLDISGFCGMLWQHYLQFSQPLHLKSFIYELQAAIDDPWLWQVQQAKWLYKV